MGGGDGRRELEGSGEVIGWSHDRPCLVHRSVVAVAGGAAAAVAAVVYFVHV